MTLATATPTVFIGSKQAGVFTETSSVPALSPLTINYTIQGSAINGTDYALLGDTLTLAAGATSGAIDILPKSELEGGTRKIVKLTLAPVKLALLDAAQ